jgi:hypothetical protein
MFYQLKKLARVHDFGCLSLPTSSTSATRSTSRCREPRGTDRSVLEGTVPSHGHDVVSGESGESK